MPNRASQRLVSDSTPMVLPESLSAHKSAETKRGASARWLHGLSAGLCLSCISAPPLSPARRSREACPQANRQSGLADFRLPCLRQALRR